MLIQNNCNIVEIPKLYFKESIHWHEWLIENYNTTSGAYLIFYKLELKKPTMRWEDAVKVALCFGWIDSTIKKLDENRFIRKFTPRKEKSNWSELNKKRAAKLIRNKRMTKIGLVKIEIAKENGQWDKPDRPDIKFEIPKEFQLALDKNKKAKIYFNTLTQSYQKQYIGWIVTAKQKKTKEKRIGESIILLAKGEKLGLK